MIRKPGSFRLAADENLDNRILNGLRRRVPALDIVRVQDVGLSGARDPAVLEWAAQEGRIVLSHDVSTITHYAYERLRVGRPVPGIFEVHARAPIGRVIDDLLLILEVSEPGDWEGQVRYLPL